MKAIAIIPARSGSKGVRRKNMRFVFGKTLVQRSIEHAMESKSVVAVLVSSDSEEILKHAEANGAVPVLRPDELATDIAATDPVMVHALKEYALKEYDGEIPEWTVLLQPTSPVRPNRLVDRCVRKAESRGCKSVFTAYDAHFAWKRGFSHPDGEPYLINSLLPDRAPRQLMRNDEKVYVENGCVYVTKTTDLLETGQRLISPIEIMEMNKEDSIDIDTEYDLWISEQRIRWLDRKGQAA